MRHLRDRISDPEGMIRRKTLHGNTDEGDIKSHRESGPGVQERQRVLALGLAGSSSAGGGERGVDYGMVVFHRLGRGEANMDQFVPMDWIRSPAS